MGKLKAAALVGILAAASLTVASPAKADGPECNPGSHCYGIAHYETANFDAFGLEMWTDCLHLDTPLSDFATNEVWTFHANGFFETGYVRGLIAGGDSQSYYRLWWGEMVNGTYYSHFINWAAVNTWQNITFAKESDNTWGVWNGGLGGTKVGTTTGVASYAYAFQVGAETTEPYAYSHGKSRYLLYRDLGGFYWTAPTPWGKSNTAGVYTGTITGNDYEHWSTKNICAGITPPTSTLKKSAPSENDILKTAKEFAASNGEKTPKIETVKTKRNNAETLISGKTSTMDSNPDVVLVKMQGTFSGAMASHPKGTPSPKGSVLTMSFDSKTGELTDWSLGGKNKDLKTLGSVKKIS